MAAGIYTPIFLVLSEASKQQWEIYYLPADLQIPEMFLPREPLPITAKRAGWQGFEMRLTGVADNFVRLFSNVKMAS